jgi:hypothetical protein
MSPADQSGYRGQQLTYRLTLVNNDNPQCSVTTFTLFRYFTRLFTRRDYPLARRPFFVRR